VKNIDSTFEPMKRGAKRFIPALKERDDFEVKIVSVQCSECDQDTTAFHYRFEGENEWIEHKPRRICKQCEIKQHLVLDQEQHTHSVNQALMEMYWYVPDALHEAGFKNYERTNNVTANALNTCIDYVKNFKANKRSRHNLVLMGSVGTGKSHLSIAVARTLKELGFSVGFLTTGKLLSLIKENYQKGSMRTENDVLEDIKKLDILVLDDLGAEASSRDEFNWSRTKVFEIVNSRIGRPTIYTTNFDDQSIAGALGERIASRLYKQTKFIDMFTDDYRKKQRIQ